MGKHAKVAIRSTSNPLVARIIGTLPARRDSLCSTMEASPIVRGDATEMLLAAIGESRTCSAKKRKRNFVVMPAAKKLVSSETLISIGTVRVPRICRRELVRWASAKLWYSSGVRTLRRASDGRPRHLWSLGRHMSARGIAMRASPVSTTAVHAPFSQLLPMKRNRTMPMSGPHASPTLETMNLSVYRYELAPAMTLFANIASSVGVLAPSKAPRTNMDT
mmetsp:Transcript_15596/g.47063  ORF Transcript_15596/g.47063 Transcript_15596/m.47063 type:complete len:220 (+) Transcript_15596:480-1139(+)